MIAFFKWLFWGGCQHQWVESHRVNLVNDDLVRVGEVAYCTCSKCGKPVRFTLD